VQETIHTWAVRTKVSKRHDQPRLAEENFGGFGERVKKQGWTRLEKTSYQGLCPDTRIGGLFFALDCDPSELLGQAGVKFSESWGWVAWPCDSWENSTGTGALVHPFKIGGEEGLRGGDETEVRGQMQKQAQGGLGK
jgi:hypothetical protein